MLCEARSHEDACIKSAWIEDALARGEKAVQLSRTPAGELGLLNLQAPYRVYIGVDLAVSAKTSADLSAIAVVLLHPDRTRELLSMESGRWAAPEIISRTASASRRFAVTACVIESVAAQMYVTQWLKQLGSVRAIPYVTGRGERSLDHRVGIQLATQLERGQWILPSVNGRPRDREIAMVASDLAYYSPSRHCPDRVAALAFADYGCEQGAMKVEQFYWNHLR